MRKLIGLFVLLSFGTAFADIPLGRPGIIENIAGIPGKKGYSGNNMDALTTRFAHPMGLAVDKWGNIYVADTLNHRVRRIDARTGEAETVAGTGEPGFFNDGGRADTAGLKAPTALVFDRFGNLYIADTGNNRIRMLTLKGYLYTVAGNGRKGYEGEGTKARNTALNHPAGLAISHEGELYIADTGNNRIRKIDHKTGLISNVAGLGEAGADGDKGLAINARLNRPTDIIFDGHDNLYIADTRNHKIRFIEKHSGIIITLAGNGVEGYRGDNSGQSAEARFNDPTGLALDRFGRIYVSDTDNQRIRRISIDLAARRGTVETIAGLGKRGYNGTDMDAWEAYLYYPGAMVITPLDRLYFVDTGNNLVRYIEGISHMRVPSSYIPFEKKENVKDGPLFFEELIPEKKEKTKEN